MSRSVLVCGGRDYNDATKVNQTLDELHAATPIRAIVHGDARGADSLGGAWARDRGVMEQPFPADWTKHGKKAGPIRNAEMLKIGRPDLVVAFPGGVGTADMVKKARAAGIAVIEVK